MNILDKEPFLVIHKDTGYRAYAYGENDKGFLYIIPFREAGLGIANSACYTLKKPAWERVTQDSSPTWKKLNG